MKNLSNELLDRTSLINEKIYRFIPKENNYNKNLIEGMKYSYISDGKKIRPMLMLEAFRLFNKNEEMVYPFMAGIELIHTHSLVHDDLPALDNDDYRRGKLSSHKVFGEEKAILIGDALLNYAYEIMSEQSLMLDNPMLSLRAISYISKKTGVNGMINGQILDCKTEKNKDLVLKIYEEKTSALIQASLVVGGILGGAKEDELELLENIGYELGIAFQIQDDVLDIIGSFKDLGKETGRDEKNNKSTMVSYLGKEKAIIEFNNRYDNCKKLLESLPGNKEFLIDFINYLKNRRR